MGGIRREQCLALAMLSDLSEAVHQDDLFSCRPENKSSLGQL